MEGNVEARGGIVAPHHLHVNVRSPRLKSEAQVRGSSPRFKSEVVSRPKTRLDIIPPFGDFLSGVTLKA